MPIKVLLAFNSLFRKMNWKDYYTSTVLYLRASFSFDSKSIQFRVWSVLDGDIEIYPDIGCGYWVRGWR